MMTIVALAEHAEQETIQGDHEQHLFLELKQMAQEHLAVNGDEQNDAIGHNDNIHREDAVIRVDAELLPYKREQHLPLQKDDGSFSNPSDWWRLKQQQYPLLANIVLRVLAIPATSAPSERVFSTAGITIAKERSRLDPHNVGELGELIFLHDILPAIQKYEAGH
jgi:hypothetical protein